FVPSIFSSTIKDGSAINASDSFRPRCLSSSVPFEPNKCGVRGYLMKSSRDAPINLVIQFLRTVDRWNKLTFESQRDSIIQPRVARNELPWVTDQNAGNPERVESIPYISFIEFNF